MSTRVPGKATERLLNKRVRPLALFCALFVVVALGIMLINRINQSSRDIQEDISDLQVQREQAYKEYKSAEDEVNHVSSTAYVAAEARKNGYMMPNETLFIISNMPALYSQTPTPVPSETPEEQP